MDRSVRVEIAPVWAFQRRETQERLEITLGLLSDIRNTGKLSVAAARAGMSYRHAWNLLVKWSEFFGSDLVERKQGSGTSLTAFGDKLVWAAERLEARLRPLLQNLAQELQTEVNQTLASGRLELRVRASHGFAVPKLRELLARDFEGSVDFRYVSNSNSLVSMVENTCDLAGMHLPQGELRARTLAMTRGWLDPEEHRVISFVTREMGLIVGKGNPLGITHCHDLTRSGVRLVNRDPDSGTRILFDQLLAQHQVQGAAINGYSHSEFTHAAVAAYVASGFADVAFGVEAAARQFGLDFVPVLTEDYVFICHRRILDHPAMERVLAVMRGPEFAREISQLPGYQVKEPGKVKTIREVFRARG
ncbi:helix-turn-helix transcriptional regulator [Pseudomonas sp. GX19020]|uniref:helix-turn-helix transcriptional regulator n=1 Tax=Pseudomonadota TaxID=1224 RepID=UPI0008999F5B|nr:MULTISPECIES: substrate-binding domain-containing protein [Pseudomonadota]MBJ2150565.1 helix-turn-helix transcriptional regulator [Paracoccus sp. IB05]MCL4065776.1 helix-turn-helix transcriptional regulator [Pseudomonas sp. GX19020]SEC02120.1 ModE molybdate transport repressor domain-containing protein [Rhodobacter sp. 24-YEA-8]